MEDNYPKLKLQSKKSCQGNGNPLMRIAIDVHIVSTYNTYSEFICISQLLDRYFKVVKHILCETTV